MNDLRASQRPMKHLAILLFLIATVALVPAGLSAAQATITRISVSASGQQGNDSSWGGVTISADGRYIAFTSRASNLVAGDSNNAQDVFWLDRATGTLRRVSVSTAGAQGNDDSHHPVISADGQRVAFRSDATNLAPGGWYRGFYLRDVASGQTSYVAIQSGIPIVGEHWLVKWSFSPDLRYLAYAPSQDYRCWLYDAQGGITEKVSIPQPGGSETNLGDVHDPTVSADGRFVVFNTASKLDPRDTNSFRDIYMRDRELAQTICVSCPPDAPSDGPSEYSYISPDGRYIGFVSWAGNLPAIGNPGISGLSFTYLYDRVAGTLRFVNYQSGTGICGISQDGRYMAADGSYLYDLQSNEIIWLPPFDWPDFKTGSAYLPCLSADGRSFVFETDSAKLVTGDTNGEWDAFVHDRWPPLPTPTRTLTPLPSTATPTATVTATPSPTAAWQRIHLPLIMRLKPNFGVSSAQ